MIEFGIPYYGPSPTLLSTVPDITAAAELRGYGNPRGHTPKPDPLSSWTDAYQNGSGNNRSRKDNADVPRIAEFR